MSASLVGSEMCIRDSAGRRRNALESAEQRRNAGRPEQRGHADPRRRRSVSYTHLTLPTICSV
eukprot:13293636-Alexandrium_andersonii.AAC.1